MNRTSRRLLPPTALALAAALFAGQAIAGPKEDERATNAVRVLSEIQRIPENGIPDKLLDEGKAIIVIPDTIKAGLVIGGHAGIGAEGELGVDDRIERAVVAEHQHHVRRLHAGLEADAAAGQLDEHRLRPGAVRVLDLSLIHI